MSPICGDEGQQLSQTTAAASKTMSKMGIHMELPWAAPVWLARGEACVCPGKQGA